VLSDSGRLFVTKNGGKRWKELLGIGTSSADELAFSSASKGYAVLIGENLGEPNVLRTTDSGKSWRLQLVTSSSTLEVVATGDNHGLLLAGANSLFTTTTGGDLGTASKLTLKTSKRTLRKKATIKVAGKLKPAEGFEQVIVARRNIKGGDWSKEVATVASNGTFTTSWKVSKSSVFVAQWAGDDDRAGDGSSVLKVNVKRRKR
jgi:hypothetical protein